MNCKVMLANRRRMIWKVRYTELNYKADKVFQGITVEELSNHRKLFTKSIVIFCDNTGYFKH